METNSNKNNEKKSFNKSNSIIRNNKKNLSHKESYKQHYLEKENNLPLSTTHKQPILNLNDNLYNDDIVNDSNMKNTFERRNKKNKSVAFAKNVKFNNSKTINNTEGNSLNSSM